MKDKIWWIKCLQSGGFGQLFTWPGYWPLIGWEWSHDLGNGLWLAESDHVTWIQFFNWLRLITWPGQLDTRPGQRKKVCIKFINLHGPIFPRPRTPDSDHVTWILASDWLRAPGHLIPTTGSGGRVLSSVMPREKVDFRQKDETPDEAMWWGTWPIRTQ